MTFAHLFISHKRSQFTKLLDSFYFLYVMNMAVCESTGQKSDNFFKTP